jgi:GT2 family glycosyltransferase
MTTASLPGAPTAPKSVSVVINTVDRAKSLAALLAALEHQSYPHFEVIVVVGPTEDHTLEVLSPYSDRVQVLRCPTANLSESRNIGLLAARGEIVAYTDDDAVPCRNWLAQLVTAFADPQVAVVGGSVYLVHPEQPMIQHWLGMMSNLGEQQDVRLDGSTPHGKGVFWTERPMGANMALRRSAALSAGGFDGYFRWVFDDADVAMRLALAGHAVRSLTEAPVYHVPASSRNRVARTYSGRWWIVTQASTYFAMQNGRAAGQPLGDILLQVLHMVHGAWIMNWQLRQHGHISLREMWSRRLRSLAAGAQGAWHGIGARRLIPPETRRAAEGEIAPFLRHDSACAPPVDPISGERPQRASALAALPPVRIGLLSQSFGGKERSPATTVDGQAQLSAAIITAARTLFDDGHAVHVLAVGDKRLIKFEHGAYIHVEPLPADRESLLAGVRRLMGNDDIELLAGMAVDLAAVGASGIALGDAVAIPQDLSDLLPEGYAVAAVGEHTGCHAER